MRRFITAIALVAAATTPVSAQRTDTVPPPLLFMTDFGVRDGAVAVCKGVMWEIAPALRIVDISHQVPPYDIEVAGEVLEQALPFYPPGAVVVAVIDPGVGSQRKAIAVRTGRGHYLVGPDNGLFTLVLESEGLDRAVEITNPKYVRQGDRSYTFHGRDIFSPAGAHLASGVPLDSLGPQVFPIRLDVRPARIANGAIQGIVRYVEDPYGNVVTNVAPALLDSLGARIGDTLSVTIGARAYRLPWRRTFSDVPRGRSLAVMHERGLLSFSINQGDFAARNGVKKKDVVVIRLAR